MIRKLLFKTKSPKQIIDITEEVTKVANASNVTNGLVTVFCKHTTCAIVISELEADLKEDIIRFLNFGAQLGPYKHQTNDPHHTPAHIFSTIVGQSRSIPIEKGQIQLGTWQKIAILELDGPKLREIIIQIS